MQANRKILVYVEIEGLQGWFVCQKLKATQKENKGLCQKCDRGLLVMPLKGFGQIAVDYEHYA
jgi:hypothetical protein